ncbi:MAG: chloride channel protein [Acidobacteria bacterium]|nr:chloride channel protein [Acidobacteriota bacterium]
MTPVDQAGDTGTATPGDTSDFETQRFLLLSILIGIFGGLLVVCFHIAIEVVAWRSLGLLPETGVWRAVLAPAAGGALAFALVRWVFPAARGSGVNYTKEALYSSNGRIPFSTVAGKFLACSVSLGSGNSLGPEDPALQMGAGVASLLGRAFRLTTYHLRLIAPVGAAAGIGAAFNTPITAVLFVIEEVIGGWNAAVLGSIVLSAVAAVVVSRSFLGDAPLFRAPVVGLEHPSELLVYAGLGLAVGLMAVAYVRIASGLRGHLRHAVPSRRIALPVAAGLFVGLVGLWLPQVLSVGYHTVDGALHSEFTWRMLLLLGLAKILVTSACFAAGTPGGLFAPTLFAGAMLGGAAGGLAIEYWPAPTGPLGTYVLVGMGAFFAAVFRAPMTSIFMVFEVSASYVVILPVMVANTMAYLISRRLQPISLFDLVARQDGLELPSGEDQREARVMRVEDALRRPPCGPVAPSESIDSALARLDAAGADLLVVRLGDGRWSVVRRELVEVAARTGTGHLSLHQVLAPRPLPKLHPDQTLDAALRLLRGTPLLPVVGRTRGDELLGVISLDDVLEVYGLRPRADSGPDVAVEPQ